MRLTEFDTSPSMPEAVVAFRALARYDINSES
jgi:hypothetical protein